jgi:dihydroorotate dehydrogenase (fumarate)
MDLSTRYMGLELKHPVLPGPGPLTHSIDDIRRLEDAGAPAICLFSLFEEQITMQEKLLDHYLSYGANSYAEALSFFPEAEAYDVGPDSYLELIRSAKSSVDVPVIASLNGVSSGGWIEYARKIQDAGADALELNIFFLPTDPGLSGWDIEMMYEQIVSDVRASISIPLAVKLSPFFTSPVYTCRRLQEKGANGFVLFNRFYQPDIDLEQFEIVPRLRLSDSDDLLLPLRWTGILYNEVPVDFAISSGVHTSLDVIKTQMVGARVAMVVSELLRNGLGRIRELVGGMQQWMEENEYASVRQMQGSMSRSHVREPAAFARANYMKVLQSWPG